MTLKEKITELKKNNKKDFNKYLRTMSYCITSAEIDALYNVLILNSRSKYKLTQKWENKVIEVLNRSVKDKDKIKL